MFLYANKVQLIDFSFSYNGKINVYIINKYFLGAILGEHSKSADVKAAIELAINKTNGDVDMPFRLNVYIEDGVDVADSYSVINTGLF